MTPSERIHVDYSIYAIYKLTERYIKLMISRYLSQSRQLDSRLAFFVISSPMH